MLGMTYSTHRFTTPFLLLHSIVFVVGVVEIASPSTYAESFRILDYYVSTRDFSANAFWNTESTLFVSATRTGARFFGFVDWHRGSSIFLEPVSLGNYCVIAAIFIIACWGDLSRRARLYLVFSTLFLLVACDGRFAATSIGMVVVGSLFLRNVSSRWVVFYLPASLIAAAIFVAAFGTGETTDNFVGRVTGTVDALSRVDFLGLMGLTTYIADGSADFGIVYFILSQSAIGVAVTWGMISLLMQGRTPPVRIYMHAIAIFFSLNLLVSSSAFSIKTAAVIWFFYGYLYMREMTEEEKPPVRRFAPMAPHHSTT
jgi:putative polymerase